MNKHLILTTAIAALALAGSAIAYEPQSGKGWFAYIPERQTCEPSASPTLVGQTIIWSFHQNPHVETYPDETGKIGAMVLTWVSPTTGRTRVFDLFANRRLCETFAEQARRDPTMDWGYDPRGDQP